MSEKVAKEGHKYCVKCGQEILQEAVVCPHCGVKQPGVEDKKSEKNPGLAAVLSAVWAGLGQIYNGEIMKGILIMFAYGVSAFLTLVVIGFITTPIIWIWSIWDAYKTAERINKGEVKPKPEEINV